MGRVSSSFPVTLNAVKTAYGATGTRTLRAFLAGGSFANTYTANETGSWLPASGTITLSQLRGATNLNVTFSGSNTNFTAFYTDLAYGGSQAFASASIKVCANGRIQLYGQGSEGGSISPNPPTNTWLLADAGDVTSTVGGMYQVLFVKTGGNSLGQFGFNNTWQTCSTDITQTVSASRSVGSETATVKGRMKFRRTSDGTELANVYVELDASAASFTGVEP